MIHKSLILRKIHGSVRLLGTFRLLVLLPYQLPSDRAQLSDAAVSKQLLLQKKFFDKNCRGSCESQLFPEKFCDSTEIKKDIRSKQIFNPLFIFIIDF